MTTGFASPGYRQEVRHAAERLAEVAPSVGLSMPTGEWAHTLRAGTPLDRITHNCATVVRDGPKPMVPSREALTHPVWHNTEDRRAHCRDSSIDRPHLGLFRPRDGKGVVVPCACHTRLHDGCRPSDLVESIDTLREIVEAWGGRCSLLTLTSVADGTEWSRDRHLWLIWRRWRHFLDMARSCHHRKGRGLCCATAGLWLRPVYVAVVELTPTSGWPHIHAVCSTEPWETREVERRREDGSTYTVEEAAGSAAEHVKRAWMRVSPGAYQVKWEVLRGNGRYVAKYVTKTAGTPRSALAFMSVNRRRWYNRSPGLKPAKRTEWIARRGKKGVAEAFVMDCQGERRHPVPVN